MKSRPGVLLCAAAFAATGSASSAQSAATIKLRPAESKLAEEFTTIVAARELADGRVLVADLREKRLVVADFAAGTVTTIGRNGQGPLEYQNPRWLHRLGADSTLLVEQNPTRWHLLHGAKLVTSLPLVNANRQALGADAQGNTVRTSSFVDNKGASIPASGPDSMWILREHRGTARVDTLGRTRAVKSIMSSTTNARGEVTSISITRPPFAVGEEIALFEDGWLAIARLDPYRVDWIAPDGRAVKGRPLPWPTAKITERDLEAFYRSRNSGTSSAPPAEQAEALRRQVETAMKLVPEFMPPTTAGGLVAMDDGRLLVRHPATAAFPDARYDVVDRRGALVGSIAMGKGETIVAISKTWAYVVTTDNDGLQFLSRHPWTARPFAP